MGGVWTQGRLMPGAKPIRVLAYMKYGPLAASTRQRLLQYAAPLRAAGIEIDYLPLLDDAHIARIAAGRPTAKISTVCAYLRRFGQLATRRGHDIVWVHCELFPYLPGPFERLAGWGGRPVVYDFDDAIFHMYDLHPSRAVRRLLGQKLAPLLSGAAAAIGGNAYLRDYVARYCTNALEIPTVVDTDAYVPARRPAGANVTVGWIGSPSTWRYVEPLVPPLCAALAPSGSRFRVVGAGPGAQGIIGIDAISWNEATEIAEVQAMDIGIMPLPDDPWARGKCGYKLIQYMACGLPVVASPVGVNREIVTHGVTGFLAETTDEWIAALVTLIGDPALRRRMGAAGRARIEQHYSLRSQLPRMESLLRAAAVPRARRD